MNLIPLSPITIINICLERKILLRLKSKYTQNPFDLDSEISPGLVRLRSQANIFQTDHFWRVCGGGGWWGGGD